MRKLFRNKFTYIVAMTLVCAMSLAACGNKMQKLKQKAKSSAGCDREHKKAEKQKR